MDLELEVVFNHIFLKQPSDRGVTMRGQVRNRTGGETADGRVREKGVETKEGVEEENIRIVKGSRKEVQIEEEEEEKGIGR